MQTLAVSDAVSVQIVMSPKAAAVRDFGALLILGASPVVDVTERIRQYSNLDGVVSDFGNTAPEYLAANLYYSQSPQPETLFVGRWAKTATSALLKGGALSAEQQEIDNFTAITTGAMKITIDGTEKSLTAMDFSGVTNLNGVASIVTTKLASAGTCAWNATFSRFEITSATTGATSTIGYASQSGMILLNATSGNVTVTLPAANAALGVSEFTIRRTDATTNTAAIAVSGSNRIMLDTAAAAAGVTSTELLFSGDYLVLRSDGAGKWWCVGQAQLPDSIATGLRVFSTPGVSSFTVPPVLRSGRRRAKVIVTGGGGGTAGTPAVTTGNTALSPAGGAGATAIRSIDLSGVSTVSVTVGALGARGGTNGSNGGASSFGAYCTAGGGNGTTGVTVAGTSGVLGGKGGTASGGDINLNGGDGSSVYSNGGSFTPVVNGNGGASYWGGGPGAYTDASVPGTGGGSSEGQVGDPATPGFNGAPGIVTVEW